MLTSTSISTSETGGHYITAAIECAWKGDVNRAHEVLVAKLGSNPVGLSQIQNALLDCLDATVRIYGGEYESALKLILPQLSLAEQSTHRDQLDWLYTAIAFALGAMGDPERGLEWVGRAMAMTETHPHSAGRRKAHITEGSLLGQMGDHAGAHEALQQAFTVAQAQGELRAMAICCGNIAANCLQQARLQAADSEAQRTSAQLAIDHASRALDLNIPDGRGQGNIAAHVYRAQAWTLLGDHAKAREELQAQVQLVLTNPHRHVELLLALAQSCCATHEYEQARAHLMQAHSMAQSHSLERILLQIFPIAVRLEIAAEDTAAALAWSERHCAFLEAHYRHRLQNVARSAELFAEAERLRKEAELLRSRSEAWEHAALRDTLTGIFNRRGLAQHSIPLFATARETALAAFDADHFKMVNDRFGHAVGDQVLKALARIIHTHIRGGDVLARTGGEEFVLLLADASLESAQHICERIRVAIESNDWEKLSAGLRLTSSIGLAARTVDDSLDTLIARADVALYAAKNGGRNRVQVAA